MTLVMGCDPHLDRFAVAVVDHLDRVVFQAVLENDPAGWDQAVALAAGDGVSRVGIEGASGHGRCLAAALTAAEIPVVEVPTRVTVKTRRIDGASKSDPGDARAIARALWRGEGSQWVNDPTREALRVVTHRRDALVRQQTTDINTLRCLLEEVDPPLAAATGRIRSRRALVAFTEMSYTADLHQVTVTDMIRRLAETCVRRHDEITDLKTRLRQLMPAAGHRLITEIQGIGVITAAMLLAELAGTHGFTTDAKMAMWAGTAPLDASSGRQQRHRLNRYGNRQANRAIWIIALTQLRHGGEGATYINRRITEGKTQREAIRALKRHITRRIWRTLNKPD